MKITVGVVQESPVFFDKAKTIDKIEEITKREAANGHELFLNRTKQITTG